MAYQHYNRLIAHWQPKSKTMGEVLSWGSKERYESLTPGAVAIAQFVAQHLNSESNVFPISQKTICMKLGFAKSTASLALEELVARGIFSRERPKYDLPYLYRLAIDCPDDCSDLTSHNTKSEIDYLSERSKPYPQNQENTLPEIREGGDLKNRQVIETYKQSNKKMSRRSSPCSSCSGEYEVLPDSSREIIHASGCSQLRLLREGQAWKITESQIGPAWSTLDIRSQQIANYLSLSKAKERREKQVVESIELNQALETRFQKIISRTLAENGLRNYSPAILEWLGIVYNQRQNLTDTHISRAVRYSRLGWTLCPEGDWRSGGMLKHEHFLESKSSEA